MERAISHTSVFLANVINVALTLSPGAAGESSEGMRGVMPGNGEVPNCGFSGLEVKASETASGVEAGLSTGGAAGTFVSSQESLPAASAIDGV